ncbi:Uncharacterized protein dnm_047630 [Desulfonema magnum]|uniref:Uncharacterized protein n=1 Tax=Desulfonema magnum TaxID=45655 RepID=A0A975BNH6_9BACT|nr:Uncharacterized protein dnm_047630 [Desulfonema magnum]
MIFSHIAEAVRVRQLSYCHVAVRKRSAALRIFLCSLYYNKRTKYLHLRVNIRQLTT